MYKYEQTIDQDLNQIRLSGTLSEEDFRLLSRWTRYLAMLDVPAPEWALTRWLCNQLGLVEAWYRWHQSGRIASAAQQLPPQLLDLALEILAKANN